MTFQLKSCPFCAKPLTIRNGVNPYGRCDTEGCWMAEAKIGISCDDPKQVERWNTRPAPAATDTGLVTAKVEHRVHFGEDGNPTEWREGYGMGLYPQGPIVRVEVREYVTRSQAEELLTAERAKYRDAMEKLVESQRETLVWQQRAINLKSDNAAKDKLLKEAFHV